MTESRRAFTLIELLTAIAIFGLLAGMLFQMLKGGLDVWSKGERQREAIEKSSAVLDEIARELRLAAAPLPGAGGEPLERFVVDWVAFDLDGDDVDETQVQRLRFVRSLPEERTDPLLRAAGETPGGSAVSADVGPGGEARARRAPAGRAEVLYTTLAPRRKGGDPARLSLVRLFRTPAGGDESVFGDERYLERERLVARAVPVVDGVLFFGVELALPDTVSFDRPAGTPGGPCTTWDSTRGLLLDEVGANRFAFAVGEESLSDGEDDVLPRWARLTLTLEPDEDEAEWMRLLQDLTPRTTRFRVDSTRGVDPSAPHPFVKIDGEWMRVKSADGGWLSVQRGVRGSAPAGHRSGTRVHFGRTYSRLVEIPAHREVVGVR